MFPGILSLLFYKLNPTIPNFRSATNLAFAPASYSPQCHESGIRACIPSDIQCTNPAFEPEFLPSAVPRIWHSCLHSLRHSVHESCIRARISTFRSATNLAFAPEFPQILLHLCHSTKDLTRDVTEK